MWLMDVDAYIAAAPEGRQPRLREIRSLILGLYPDAEESMEYRMPTYRTRDGWVAVANQKQYVSLYTCDARHLASFKAAYPQIKTGKGCINLRDREPLPEEEIKAVIRSACGADPVP